MDLLIAALAPIGALLLIIYKIDRYNREPAKLLVKLFIMGGLIAVPVIIVEGFLGYLNIFTLTKTDLQHVYTAFVVAAFTEEFFKWLIFKGFAYNHKAYDEYLDGIVYAVFVSLGFAAFENIGYVFANRDMNVAFMRALTALPGHMLFGVSMGYHFSIMKFAKTKRSYQRALKYSLLMPIVIHGVYDYILMSSFKWLVLLFIPYLIWMWQYGLRRIKTYYDVSKEAHDLSLAQALDDE